MDAATEAVDPLTDAVAERNSLRFRAVHLVDELEVQRKRAETAELQRDEWLEQLQIQIARAEKAEATLEVETSATVRILEDVRTIFERLEDRNLADRTERDLVLRLNDHLFKLRESKKPAISVVRGIK